MNEYWKKRNSELLKIHAQKADDIERELIKEYEKANIHFGNYSVEVSQS